MNTLQAIQVGPEKLSLAPTGLLERKSICSEFLNSIDEHAGHQDQRLSLPQKSSVTELRRPAVFRIPSIVREVLNSPGQSLDASTQGFMESRFEQNFSRVPIQSSLNPALNLEIARADDPLEREADAVSERALNDRGTLSTSLGTDFRDVRIHIDAKAAKAAQSVNAEAFSLGSHIVFNAGKYEPNTTNGKRLLAHELAHVALQSGRQPATPATIRRKAGPEPAEQGGPDLNDLSVAPSASNQPSAVSQTEGKPEDLAVDGGVDNQPPEIEEPGRAKPETRDDSKTDIQPKVVQGRGKTGRALEDTAAQADKRSGDTTKDTEVQSLADLALGSLALIDEELAEHQRWGAATATVGTAGSHQRAEFIAQAAAGGAESGLSEGLVKGLKTGAGIKVAEKLLEKGITKGAVALATRLGAQATKMTPLPGVGAAIGGVLAAYDLASRDWKATGEAIGRFGKGASIYDNLANSIEAVSNVLEVADQVLNVIAGVLGAITVVMWVLSVVTAGALSPVAGVLTTIAAAIGIATMILDAINSLVLKRLIMTFRALHSFTSEADPRDVITQGSAISQAAGAASGFVGGLVGGLAGGAAVEGIGKGIHGLGSKKPSTPVPDHPTPPAAPGEGPTVKAEAMVEGQNPLESAQPTIDIKTQSLGQGEGLELSKTAVSQETGTTPKPATEAAIGPKASPAGEPPFGSKGSQPVDEASFSELNDLVGELSEGPFGKRLQAEQVRANQPPPTAPAGTRYGRSAYRLLRRMLRREQPAPPGTQAQHWTKWLASTRDITNPLERMTPEMISENRSWLQTDPNRPATLLLSDPRGGTKYFIGDRAAPAPSAQMELPGLEAPKLEPRFTTEHRFADNYLIPEAAKKMPAGPASDIKSRVPLAGNPNLVNLWAGAEARWQLEGIPGQGDWGWQPRSSAQVPVQLPLLPGGKPEIPRSIKAPAVDPRQLSFTFDKQASDPRQLDLFSQALTSPPEITPGAQPRVRVATEEISSDLPKIRVTDEATIESQLDAVALAEMQEEQELTIGAPPARLRSPMPREYGKSAKEEPESGFERNMREFSQMTRSVSSMTTTEKLVYLAGGPVTGGAAITAMRGFEKARSEPIVEHVNPNYPAPPCSPHDLTVIQNEILEILDARSQTQDTATAMAAQQAHHKANERPLTNMQKGTEEAISATTAHQQEVAKREKANEQKKENEGQAGNLLKDYSDRAARLTTITEPMRAFSQFASLAYSLPDSLPQSIADTMPDFVATRADAALKAGKRNLIKMHKDSKNFLAQLESMDATVNTQEAGQPDREKKTESDAATLSQTGNSAKESDHSLTQAKQTTEDLDAKNKDRLHQATQLHAEADQAAASLDAQAQQKKAFAQSLAASLEIWAQNHKKARLDALEQTKTRMEQQGYRVIEVKER